MHRFMILSSIAAIVLAGAPALAQSGACNQEMLRGVWCETCSGFADLSKIDPKVPKGTLVPFAMLLRYVVNADGKGTGKGFSSLAGAVGQIEAEATFTVNPGCTGEKAYVLKTGSGLSIPGKAAVIFLPSGLEFHVLIQSAGDVVTCKWQKMFHHLLVD